MRLNDLPTSSRRKRHSRTGVPLLAALVLLSGCATTPMPDLHASLPAHWRHQVQLPSRPAVDLHGWWKAFHDPMLNQLVDQALKSNLDVAQAVERLRAERALYDHAQAPNRPHLRFRTDDPVDPDATASYFVAGFDATWELGLFGRAKAMDRQARGRLGDAAASLRQARVSLVAEVARNWIELRAAQQREALLERMAEARRIQVKLTRTRVRLKLDAPATLARAQAAAAKAQEALDASRQTLDATVQGLAVLLGREEPDPAWLKPALVPALGPTGPVAAPAELLRTRPEIARAEARVVEAAGELGIAHADLYPNIGLGASLLWSTDTFTHHRYGSTHKIGSIGPVIDIPLFDWGMRKSREEAQSHLLKAAVLAYRKAVLSGVADVETALGRLQQSRAGERQAERAASAWKRALRDEQTRQRLGLASGIDTASAEISRADAELNLIGARSRRDMAYVALYKALGGAPPLPKSDDNVSSASEAAH